VLISEILEKYEKNNNLEKLWKMHERLGQLYSRENEYKSILNTQIVIFLTQLI